MALALSLGLMAALAASAGAAVGDSHAASRVDRQSPLDPPGIDRRVFGAPTGKGPAARLAASGDFSAGTILNGLIDAASSAAGVTGPQGFLLGAALFFIKGAIGSAEGGNEAEKADAKLTAIEEKLDGLKKQLGDATFDLQVGKTDDWISDIRGTEKKLREALDKAEKASNKKLPADEREEASGDFDTKKAEFIEGARELVKRNVADKLSEALIDHQETTTVNPEKRPALLNALRRKIADDRFLTANNQARIRDFFKYYEWWQTRLAALLSEYYMLGGPCAWTNPPAHCAKPPKPERGSAKDAVQNIQDNLIVQRQYLPPAYLDSLPPDEQSFIDSKTKLRWLVDPTYRSSKNITAWGNFSRCRYVYAGPYSSPNCRLDAPLGADAQGLRVPTLAEAQKLFENHTGNAVSWLKTADVTFDDPKGTRFPGYAPDMLKYRVALWLRDGWQIGDESLFAHQLVLEPAAGGPFQDPKVSPPPPGRPNDGHYSEVGYECKGTRNGSEFVMAAVPSCARWAEKGGGFILWTGDLPSAVYKLYCGSRWDVTPVVTVGTPPRKVSAPASVPQLC